MIFGLLYEIGLHLFAAASLPKMFTHFSTYKGTFLQRLGKNFPHIEKKDKKLIWIHAVSLGETKAVAPLIKKLKGVENPPLILLSTTTKTGHNEGLKNALEADFHVYLPFDFRYVIRPIIKRVRPDVVILTETDFWYNFQEASKKVGAKLIVVNGKISERSFKRLSKIPFLTKRLLGQIDHFYVQGELYRSRFLNLKIHAPQLTVAGNLKLDSDVEICDVKLLKERLCLSQEPVLTLGSTHDPEERLWISALKELWIKFPQLKVFLVPRHPERFESVAQILDAEKINYARWSAKGSFHQHSLLLVDAIGVLRQCYQISDIAFVGGSFTSKVGGHNILEPAFYGKPVLYGPHMHAQPDFCELVSSFKAGLQITENRLIPTIQELLLKPSYRLNLGANGQKLIASSRGALNQTFHCLMSLLQKEPSC